MARAEFSKATRRAALKRSNGYCEAVGSWYGLADGQRCNFTLSQGVQFDHVDLEANSHDASLTNCAAVCPRCHSHKTRTRDTPLAAKTVRQRDKNNDIRRKYHWAKRPMNPAYRPNVKQLEDL